MRFAHEFNRAQRPQWSPYYVAYDHFKTCIKLAHAKARSEGTKFNSSDIFSDLQGQCQKVNFTYFREAGQLESLQFELNAALTAINDASDLTSLNVSAARRHIARSALLHVYRTAKRLLLFLKINTDAAFRVYDKLKRAEDVETSDDEVDRLFPRPNPSDVLSIVAWTKTNLEILLSPNIVPPEIWSAYGEEILRPFFKVSAMEQMALDHEMQPTHEQMAKDRLSRLIQLAGFSRTPQRPSSDSDSSNRSIPDEFWSNIIRAEFQRHTDFDSLFKNGDDRLSFKGSQQSLLHYAAESGDNETAALLLREPLIRELLLTSTFIKHDANFDLGTASPLTLAVCSGKLAMTDQLLSAIREHRPAGSGKKTLLPQSLAHIALEASDLPMLGRILDFGVEISKPDSRGRLSLCTAVRRMPEACHLLLDHGAEINIVESSSGRTALGLACISGDLPLVQLLLRGGADANLLDSRGWSPLEHAAYRGHFKIALALIEAGAQHSGSALTDWEKMATSPLVRTDRSPRSHIPWIQQGFMDQVGSSVWISIGSNDATKATRPIQLNETYRFGSGSLLEAEVLYTIAVSVEGRSDTSHEWSLPLLHSTSNAPWFFRCDSVDDLKLLWKLYTYTPDFSSDKPGKELIASGVALMGQLNAGVRPNRESLVRDTTIPLQDSKTLAFVGTVTFSYFSSTPHPPPSHLAEPQYWEFGNGIGGHRGSGKNVASNKKLQIGENTAQSFSTAIEHGAAFLEFDVQLTKDLVPVIYHDFLISETGTDSTMHTLSFDQFNYLSHAQAPRRPREKRSNSLQSADNGYLEVLQERMARTHFNRVNGFKANTRGTFIHEKSMSLDEVFRTVPESVRMNIEIKYPMLFEAHEWDMELLAIKTDIFVDTILDKLYEHAQGRTIVFSSFSPEICVALSTKQRSFPVFFLSKTAAPRGEVRSQCIQQAIHFAKSWGLPGIVTECTPLIKCPRLIEYVRSAGLACTSFGAANSDPENAKVQFDAGINAVISDSVRGIVQLTQLPETNDESLPVRIYP